VARRRRTDRFTREAAALNDWERAKADGRLWYIVPGERRPAIASLSHRGLAEQIAKRRNAMVVDQRTYESWGL
jgi:hypothetical protein